MKSVKKCIQRVLKSVLNGYKQCIIYIYICIYKECIICIQKVLRSVYQVYKMFIKCIASVYKVYEQCIKSVWNVHRT